MRDEALKSLDTICVILEYNKLLLGIRKSI